MFVSLQAWGSQWPGVLWEVSWSVPAKACVFSQCNHHPNTGPGIWGYSLALITSNSLPVLDPQLAVCRQIQGSGEMLGSPSLSASVLAHPCNEKSQIIVHNFYLSQDFPSHQSDPLRVHC